MTGAGKLAATLIGGIIMLSARGAAGQQPSNAVITSSDIAVAPPSTAPHLPAEMPPSPPKVTCDGETLTISAQNSTLGAVLNAIRTCTGAQIEVPEDARGERLFAELGPGPLRTVLADFLSSTDFNYVIKASPSDSQKVQMVLLSPRSGDSVSEVATVADNVSNVTPNRRGWLKARDNYMKSFTASRDDSSQETDTTSSAPVEATIPATNSVAADATVPAGSPVAVDAMGPAASAAPVEATAPSASAVPIGAAAPAPSSVPSSAEPANTATAPAPGSPAQDSLPAQSSAGDPIASASTGSDTSPRQDDKTQQMITNMQRMFEQRKQMMQQQQTSAPPQ